eukprot:4050369-Pleurochrysis_carterae.AAC.1
MEAEKSVQRHHQPHCQGLSKGAARSVVCVAIFSSSIRYERLCTTAAAYAYCAGDHQPVDHG